MKITRITLIFALMIGLSAPAFSQWPGAAQWRRVLNGSSSNGKFGFYFETRLDPSTPELVDLGGGSATESNGVIHRYLTDRGRRVYFGYDASVEVLPEPNTYRVTFQQLTLSEETKRRVLGADFAAWMQLTIPPGWGFAPRTVRAGEVLSVDLLTNGSTGQKIVELITIHEPATVSRRPDTFEPPPPRREFTSPTGPARDFTASDAALRIRAARLSINGKVEPSSAKNDSEVAGTIVFFYVPNRGRFLLSLAPHPEFGFQKAGEVRGSTLSFNNGADAYTVSTGGAITPNDAAFNLYVLYQPTWRPTYANADTSAFIMGSADRVESLLK